MCMTILIYVYVFVFLYIYMCVHMWMCARVCIACACKCMCARMRVCMGRCVYVYACVRIRTFVWVHVCMCSVRVYVYYVYACVCLCGCTYAKWPVCTLAPVCDVYYECFVALCFVCDVCVCARCALYVLCAYARALIRIYSLVSPHTLTKTYSNIYKCTNTHIKIHNDALTHTCVHKYNWTSPCANVHVVFATAPDKTHKMYIHVNIRARQLRCTNTSSYTSSSIRTITHTPNSFIYTLSCPHTHKHRISNLGFELILTQYHTDIQSDKYIHAYIESIYTYIIIQFHTRSFIQHIFKSQSHNQIYTNSPTLIHKYALISRTVCSHTDYWTHI